MRILSIRSGHEAEDLDVGRATLLAEIRHPRKVVMLVRGVGADIGRFADRANGRAADFPWRSVVWVQDDHIFADGQETELFGDAAGCCAVVLGLDDRPATTLEPDATLLAIDRAFRNAETGGGQ